jgi:hypothetical protein
MQPLTEFVRDALTAPRGVPDTGASLLDRVHAIDEHTATTGALTWSIAAGAGLVGAASFTRLIRAAPMTPTATLVARATVCTWSLVAISLAKLWHNQEQNHSSLMKELLLLDDRIDSAARPA